MKLVKIILAIIVILAVILGVGGYYLFKNLDGIVATAIEDVGSDVLHTQVKVASVKLTLSKGRGEIHGLSIANPQGFTQPTIFKLKQVALQVDPTSLRDPVIVLDEVLVDGADLTLEHTGVAKTNVQTLMANMNLGEGKSQKQSSDSNTGPEPHFMIKRLAFTHISMDVVSPQFKNRTVKLKGIVQHNIGSREQGLTAEQLAQAIVKPLIDKAQDRAEDELKGRAKDEVKKALEKNLSDKDKKKLEKYKSLFGR